MKEYRGVKILRAELGYGLAYTHPFRIDNGDVQYSSGSLKLIKNRIDLAFANMDATVEDNMLMLTSEKIEEWAAGDLVNVGWYTAPVTIIDRETYVAEKKAKLAADLAAGKIVVGQTVKVKYPRRSKKHLQGVIGEVIFVSEVGSYSGTEAKIKTRSGEIHRVIIEELVTVKPSS